MKKTSRRNFMKHSAFIPAAIAMGAVLAQTNLVNAQGTEAGATVPVDSCATIKPAGTVCGPNPPSNPAVGDTYECDTTCARGNLNQNCKKTCVWSTTGLIGGRWEVQ